MYYKTNPYIEINGARRTNTNFAHISELESCILHSRRSNLHQRVYNTFIGVIGEGLRRKANELSVISNYGSLGIGGTEIDSDEVTIGMGLCGSSFPTSLDKVGSGSNTEKRNSSLHDSSSLITHLDNNVNKVRRTQLSSTLFVITGRPSKYNAVDMNKQPKSNHMKIS